MLNRDEFADNQEGQVPYALRDFFTAFASKTIKEGMYSYLLGNVLASLEEAHSMVCADKLYAYKLLTVVLNIILIFFLLVSVKGCC